MATAVRTSTVAAEPAWGIAQIFPHQGQWSEEEYLGLTTNHLVEFSHGTIEVLAMPTRTHQRLVAYLYQLLSLFVTMRSLGEVFFAPYRVQLWPGKYREPDILFLSNERSERATEAFAQGADLVIEVVSPDDPRRDLEIKRREYAQAGIPEYWIVDPTTARITVLTLASDSANEFRYAVHGEFGAGEQATSQLLPGFTADVDAVFAAAS